jgi:hypothetical protein
VGSRDICDIYCSMIQSVCRSSIRQYLSIDECISICSQFHVNGTYDNSDTGAVVDTGDTIQCRMTWLIQASIYPQASTYCPYASGYTPYTACGESWTYRPRPWLEPPDDDDSSSTGDHIDDNDDTSDQSTTNMIIAIVGSGVGVTIASIVGCAGWRWHKRRLLAIQQARQQMASSHDHDFAPLHDEHGVMSPIPITTTTMPPSHDIDGDNSDYVGCDVEMQDHGLR